MKKILLFILCIVGIGLFAFGCGAEKTPQSGAPVENPAEKPQSGTPAEDPAEEMQAALLSDENIDDITWSDDKSFVLFTKDVGDYERHFFIWRTDEEEAAEIGGIAGNLYGITLSPDNRYATVNEGTSVVRGTFLLTSDDMQVTGRFTNTGGPVWSPDSKKIAFAVVNDKKPAVDIETDGTCDIMIYSVETGTKETVMEADSDFLLDPLSWDDRGLAVRKNYLDGRDAETVIYHE